ncbi:MAG: pyridoxal phosphate-dependent aminotransferase [Eubacterium sp.]|nr:pyridoxal phosphate-dependent aminotransferase [Eubacterium sp.]
MYTESLVKFGKVRSEIRDLFEYGMKRKAEIGEENVYDFSIGNPSVPTPQCVNDAIKELVDTSDSISLHGYTSAQGDAMVRKTVADHLNKKYGAKVSADNIYMTCGAAAALSIVMNACMQPGDECLVIKPYFPEYGVYIERSGAKVVEVDPEEKTLQIDIDNVEAAINENTKAIVINSPNNPSGVVYKKDKVEALCELLKKKEEEYGHPIFIITDEPYRELIYDDIELPYLINYYDNTFSCYSFSKALSMPGERIGYVVVSPKIANYEDAYAAVCGSGRALGYVCAPSLWQKVVAKCVDATADISIYKKNRDLFYNSLTEMGFECVYPDGAFYLFVKAMEEDSRAFSDKCKEHEILVVPADSFGMPGYVRVSYCVETKQIEDALPAFKALAEEYK